MYEQTLLSMASQTVVGILAAIALFGLISIIAEKFAKRNK